MSIEDPCADPPAAKDGCRRHALDRVVKRLTDAKAGTATVRILHLGDSHVASDYITRTVRERLQREIGDAGRGFTVIDQQLAYGGRREPGEAGWERDRIVDRDRAGRPFGFSGTSLESKKKGATLSFKVLEDEPALRIFYQAQPDGGALSVMLDGKPAGELDTASSEPKSLTKTLALPFPRPKAGKKPSKKPHRLKLVAKGPKARLYGIAFDSDRPGVIYESIGPLGGDAKVYDQLDPNSFKEHLIEDAPDLIVLMVGGNDAMKIRKGWTDLAHVRQDHQELIDLLRSTLPRVDCLLWAPMDSGDKLGKTVVSRTMLKEVRDLQREIAAANGCAFWDLYESMGGEGSIARWVDARVMNADLVHPRDKAAELLGELFVEAWMERQSRP